MPIFKECQADLSDICCGEPYGRSEARRPVTLIIKRRQLIQTERSRSGSGESWLKNVKK